MIDCLDSFKILICYGSSRRPVTTIPQVSTPPILWLRVVAATTPPLTSTRLSATAALPETHPQRPGVNVINIRT